MCVYLTCFCLLVSFALLCVALSLTWATPLRWVQYAFLCNVQLHGLCIRLHCVIRLGRVRLLVCSCVEADDNGSDKKPNCFLPLTVMLHNDVMACYDL